MNRHLFKLLWLFLLTLLAFVSSVAMSGNPATQTGRERVSAAASSQARILFDEGHNEWWIATRETAQRVDPNNTGAHNYWDLADQLRARGWWVDSTESRITPSLLKSYDVLVIGNPSNHWRGGAKPFATEEIDSIVRFVEAGGSLLLVIHPYQSSEVYENLSALFASFGVRVNGDLVFHSTPDQQGTTNLVIPNLEDSTRLQRTLGSDLLLRGITSLRFADATSFQTTTPAAGIAYPILGAWRVKPPSAERLAVGGNSIMSAAVFGKGRAVTIGSGNLLMMLGEVDNGRLVENLFNWFLTQNQQLSIKPARLTATAPTLIRDEEVTVSGETFPTRFSVAIGPENYATGTLDITSDTVVSKLDERTQDTYAGYFEGYQRAGEFQMSLPSPDGSAQRQLSSRATIRYSDIAKNASFFSVESMGLGTIRPGKTQAPLPPVDILPAPLRVSSGWLAAQAVLPGTTLYLDFSIRTASGSYLSLDFINSLRVTNDRDYDGIPDFREAEYGLVVGVADATLRDIALYEQQHDATLERVDTRTLFYPITVSGEPKPAVFQLRIANSQISEWRATFTPVGDIASYISALTNELGTGKLFNDRVTQSAQTALESLKVKPIPSSWQASVVQTGLRCSISVSPPPEATPGLYAGIVTIEGKLEAYSGMSDKYHQLLLVYIPSSPYRPVFEFLSPSEGMMSKADTSYAIRWMDMDADSDANITLSYARPGDAGSTPIVDNISEDDETDRYNWNTAYVPEGRYVIRAQIRDQGGLATVVESAPFEIAHAKPSQTGDSQPDQSSTPGWFRGFAISHQPSKARARVLFDEGHNEWWIASKETALQADPTAYYTHNYWDLADRLRKQGIVVDSNESPITPELLERYDALVIGNPSSVWRSTFQGFTPLEMDAITQFVKRGGSLLVVMHPFQADRVYENLNQLLSRFGIRANGDVVYHPTRHSNTLTGLVVGQFESLPRLERFLLSTTMLKQVATLLMVDSVSLNITDEAIGIAYPDVESWASIPGHEEKQSTEGAALIAAALYGEGRVVAIGSGNPLMMLGSYDNGRFADALFEWFSEEMDWDGDGLLNKEETQRGTLPDDKDTDWDGWSDSIDVSPKSYMIPNFIIFLGLAVGLAAVTTTFVSKRRSKLQ